MPYKLINKDNPIQVKVHDGYSACPGSLYFGRSENVFHANNIDWYISLEYQQSEAKIKSGSIYILGDAITFTYGKPLATGPASLRSVDGSRCLEIQQPPVHDPHYIEFESKVKREEFTNAYRQFLQAYKDDQQKKTALPEIKKTQEADRFTKSTSSSSSSSANSNSSSSLTPSTIQSPNTTSLSASGSSSSVTVSNAISPSAPMSSSASSSALVRPPLSIIPVNNSSSRPISSMSLPGSSSLPFAPRQPHYFDFKAAYVQQESISLIAKIRRALTSFVKGLYSILTTLSLRKHREWALQNQPLVKIPLQQFNTLNAIRSGMDTPKVDGHPEPSAASIDEDSAYFDIASLERLQRYQSKSNDGKLSFSAVEKVEVRDSKLQTLQVESRLGQAFRK